MALTSIILNLIIYLNNTTFDNTDLSHAEIFDAKEINNTTFKNKTNLAEAQLQRSTFFENTIDNISLFKAKIERVQFLYPRFDHVNMKEVQVEYLSE